MAYTHRWFNLVRKMLNWGLFEPTVLEWKDSDIEMLPMAIKGPMFFHIFTGWKITTCGGN